MSTSPKDYLADIGDMCAATHGFQHYVLDEIESDLLPLTAVSEPLFFERMYQAFTENSTLFN